MTMQLNNAEIKCKMPITQIRTIYDERIENYKKLSQLITFYLRNQIERRKIPILEIQSRVKDFNSFVNKIRIGGYENPFEEIEDFCGIRIICVFTNHLKEVEGIVRDLFHVIKNERKKEKKKDDQFGYDSDHYIVSLKEQMLHINDFYEDIVTFKAEIQIRTILMHAWAEVSHKLVYKEEELASKPFLRNLNGVAATLEQQDYLFSNFFIENQKYKQQLDLLKDETQFNLAEGFNLENLTKFCTLFFKSKPPSQEAEFLGLFQELIPFENSINFEYIVNARNEKKDELNQLENELGVHNQVGTIKVLLDLTSDDFWEYRKKYLKYHNDFDKRIPLTNKLRTTNE